jgi:5-methylcytosine-specific restriction endonuclease McrA
MPRLATDQRALTNTGMLGYSIRQLMIHRLGKDPNLCELCGKVGKMDIHHAKYDGATLYDLVFACRRCNTQAENRGLK